MFGWFKKPKEIVENWRAKMERENKLYSVEVPLMHVENHGTGSTKLFRAHLLMLNPEVRDWCDQNSVIIEELRGDAIIGTCDNQWIAFPPFTVKIRGERGAVLFKLRWIGE
jgi:hypothetical protein